MTADQYTRCELARYAFNQAWGRGDLKAMKAICYVVRNRVRRGWHNGDWMANLAQASESASDPEEIRAGLPNPLDSQDFLRLLREVEEIYRGGSEDELSQVISSGNAAGKNVPGCLYFHFIGQAASGWFVENILRNPQEHPRKAVLGTLYLYE